jgi:GNAT superfamily N-acetyltransferase
VLKIRKARPGDERAIAEVHVASWKTTYAGLIPERFLEGLSVGDRASKWAGAIREMSLHESRKAVFVCEDSGARIVGFIAGGPEREAGCGYDGELYAVYVLSERQGQGGGVGLTKELAEWMQANSFKKMRLWVLEENPSRRFYERIGGKLLPETKDVEMGGKSLREVAYGWDDVGELARALTPTR